MSEKCKTDKKSACPNLFRRFIDDGFRITKGSILDFKYWVLEFNSLRDSITINKFAYCDSVDLFIYKGSSFTETEKIDISIFQK